MNQRAYTVETSKSCIAIFGEADALISKLVGELVSRSVYAEKISNLTELNKLRESYDLDYLVIFDSKIPKELLPSLQESLNSGESRLVEVSHLDSAELSFSLGPISKKIRYSDYVGDQALVSPTIETWIKDIRSRQAIVVPGDGLLEISLLGIDDLSRLLALSILLPSSSIGETIVLGNPIPISLLSLAYLVRTTLPFKISLSFDREVALESWSYDVELIQKNLTNLSSELVDSPESSLKFYLKSLDFDSKKIFPSAPSLEPLAVPITARNVAPAIEHIDNDKVHKTSPDPEVSERSSLKQPTPLAAPKRLTPLRSSQPLFVPLQVRKPRKSLVVKFHFPKFLKKSQSSSFPTRAKSPQLHSIVSHGLVLGLAMYLGTLAFAVTVAGLGLRQFYQTLQNDQLPESNALNSFAVTYLKANWSIITSSNRIAQNRSISEINLLLDVYDQALSSLRTASLLSNSARELSHYILGGGSSDIVQIISSGRLQAEEFYQQLSLLDGALPAESPHVLGASNASKYSSIKANLGTLKRSVISTKALLATAPDILGVGGRKKYVVLFQNNMELRATGGFIGSFAILSFENGKLYDMPIYDVYDSDGQLKGHVEPPLPIKNILGEANWYLRDSNFDPDFPTSARRAEWFIKKSLNQDLDGTIAINVNTLVSLLRALGSLEVQDYNETITADNLYERAQFHAEVNFFPGSTQKKEFLSTVADALFTKLPTLGGSEGLKIASALAETIQEKNTLISLTSPSTSNIFKTLGWNGEITNFPCPTSADCHKDYVMVVDSNFGVNKANYYIKRNVEEVITLDKNLSVTHALRLSYHNSSTSTAWPAGVYKNYQRLYLPIGSNISSVKIGDKILDSKDYAITSEHDKLVLAYLVMVPINETVGVEVVYSTPQLPQQNELTYTWYWQKQPGTNSSDKLKVYLNYPLYLRPIVISPEANLSTQQLMFDMQNDTDRRITVKFSK